ncbi:phage major capsid protein [Brevibacillus sp. SYSU BS000544]|uniref:phage major capsid protein n=1 Tax=Brevibacillus sp. SYSU BS000544 TaxID=3416443 RepID=UPI003CE513B4
MGLTNRQIIEKAAMSLSDLSSGGLMSPEQSIKFFSMIQAAPTLLKDVRLVQMKSDQMKIEKIGFGSRILRPGADSAASAGPGTIQLDAKEVMAEVRITYDSLENNIAGSNMQDVLMQMLAERMAIDLEELVVNGDPSSSDAFLQLLPGIRKQAVSHVVDFASAQLDRTAFKKGHLAIPAKYLRNPAEWKFYTSYAAELEWKDMIAARQPVAGDGGPSTVYGIPVKGIAMLQNYDNGSGTIVSDMLLCHPKNIAVGINSDIRIEVEKDIRARQFIIVLTAKIDAKFEEEDAVAKVIKVKA